MVSTTLEATDPRLGPTFRVLAMDEKNDAKITNFVRGGDDSFG